MREMRAWRRCRPLIGRLLENLESRVLLAVDLTGVMGVRATGTLVAVADHRDLIYDSARQRLYITTATGVERLDVATGGLLSSIAVGTGLQGGDITVDGKYLYIAQGDAFALHKVDLEAGTAVALSYPPQNYPYQDGGWDVVIMGTKVYFSGHQAPGYSAHFEVERWDVTTDQFIDTSWAMTYRTVAGHGMLSRSADRTTMLINQFQTMSGEVRTYFPATDTLVNNGDGRSEGGNWMWGQIAAVSRDGALFAVNFDGKILLKESATLKTVGTIEAGGGVAFSPTSDVVFVAEYNTSKLIAFDIATQQPLYVMDTGLVHDRTAVGIDERRGLLEVSPDERYFFLNLAQGVQVIARSAHDYATAGTLQASSTTVLGGAPVTFTATFGAPGQEANPTGKVTFKVGDAVLGTVGLVSGAAVLTMSLPAGGTVTAFYEGDRDFVPASASVAVTVQEQGTFLYAAAKQGEVRGWSPFDLAVAVVTDAGTFAAGGTVQVFEGDRLVGTAAVGMDGWATVPGLVLTPGKQTLTVGYGLAGVYRGSATVVTLEVGKAQADMRVAGRSSVTWHELGNALAVQVMGVPEGPSPTGTFYIYDNGTYLSAVPVPPGRPVTFTPGKYLGTHQVVAAYSGDDYYASLVSEPFSLTVPAAPGSVQPTVTIRPLLGAPVAGSPRTVTVKVHSEPGMPVPEGQILVVDNGEPLAQVALTAGEATVTVGTYAPGMHQFHASYAPVAGALYMGTSAFLFQETAQPITIDVLAVYTPEAVTYRGNLEELASYMGTQVRHANEVFTNSQLPVSLRLVGLMPVGYRDSGDLHQDLTRMTAPQDGFMDEVPGLRNRMGADLVVLVTGATTPGTSVGTVVEGVSTTLLDANDRNRSETAYLVMAAASPGEHRVLVHEVGHTMGAAHASDDPGSAGVAPYARGYRFTGNDGGTYHDVMAYDPGQMIPYFSNPRMMHQGVAMGNAATADSARVVWEQAPLVAGYRASAGVIMGGIEGVDGRTITGWVWDPNGFDAPVALRVEIDGVMRETFTADLPRWDLMNVYGTRDHGFQYTLPLLGQGKHAVALSARSASTGEWRPLATTTVTLETPLLFDEAYYRRQNGDVDAAVRAGQLASGWQHFQAAGQYERRNPSAYFDTRYYLEMNIDLAGAAAAGALPSPFGHYLASGQYESRRASPYFDERYYRLANPDVAAAVGAGVVRNGLEHFLVVGQYEDRSAIAYFDAAWYRAQHGGGLAMPSVYTHFLAEGNTRGLASSSAFSQAEYLRLNPEVEGLIAKGWYVSGLDHYLREGRQQNRSFSGAFSEASYLKKNPDVAAAVNAFVFWTGFEHWWLRGRFEGRLLE